MTKIHLLHSEIIDKIAAGEVVERPSSVVKEIVENAIDAGATSICVEIEEGGTELIRVTDNGEGISREDLPFVFARHATSKISDSRDLDRIQTLGFRGEALSSICAVSKVSITTKVRECDTGFTLLAEGGILGDICETGCENGTEISVRHLFYNTPARKKFLKSVITEGGYISDYMTRLALSRPDIAFQYSHHGITKLDTSGNGQLSDVICEVYGRDIQKRLIPISYSSEDFELTGYVGKPEISRGNRHMETFYVNQRWIKSAFLSRALEDAYSGYTMKHKYPFGVLFVSVDSAEVDVNVHPAKMEVRFGRQQWIYNHLQAAINKALNTGGTIPQISLNPSREDGRTSPQEKTQNRDVNYYMEKMRERVYADHGLTGTSSEQHLVKDFPACDNDIQEVQTSLFSRDEESSKEKKDYHIIGQVFDTYWIVAYKEEMFIVDQHAAHEKVLYEKTMKSLESRERLSQLLNPPIPLNLSVRESLTLQTHHQRLTDMGFQFEEFGGNTYIVTAIPANLFSIAQKELLMELLDHLSMEYEREMPERLVTEKVASLSCKAAVKGHHAMSFSEMKALMEDLMLLDNPYHCPHGRPVMISMTKKELEKKFKRII